MTRANFLNPATPNAIDSIAIRAHKLWAKLGNDFVLRDVNIAIARGRWTAIVGLNGAGKSSLLRVLAGLLDYTGIVELDDRALPNFSPRERARKLAWLGQSGTSLSGSAADDMMVYDVAMLGRLPHLGWLSPPANADYTAVERALRRMHAWDLRTRSFGALSGGERQRVLLARALAVEADVLLMDEPLANLDPPHQADWLHLAQDMAASGKTVVSVLHEISHALMAEDMLILGKGRVLHHGQCGSSETHRKLEAAFGERIRICPAGGQWVALPAPQMRFV
jgi:iron complex transport system ATP-binding protein